MGLISRIYTGTNPTKMIISMWVNIPQASFDEVGVNSSVPVMTFGEPSFVTCSLLAILNRFPGGPFLQGQFYGPLNGATITDTTNGSFAAGRPALTWDDGAGLQAPVIQDLNHMPRYGNLAVGTVYDVTGWNHIAVSFDMTPAATITLANQGADFFDGPNLPGAINQVYAFASKPLVYVMMNGVDCSPTWCSFGKPMRVGSAGVAGATLVNVDADPETEPNYPDEYACGVISATRGSASLIFDSGGFPENHNTAGESVSMTGLATRANGDQFGFPRSSDYPGNEFSFTSPIVRLANVKVWIGQSVDVFAEKDKFVSENNGVGVPADSLANLAFGEPDFSFRGGSTAFPINLGAGGEFTKTGTLTDFSPAPSYVVVA